MKKTLALFALMLIILASCTQKNIQSSNSSAEVKNNSEEEIKETIIEDKNATDQLNEERKISFEETPVHQCAIFNKEDGVKFCGFTRHASQKTEFSCQQAFGSNKQPYDKIGIKTIEYHSKDEAKKKFITDAYSLKGDKTKPYLFITENYNKQRIAEFYKNKKLVRITEIPTGGCRAFDKFVELAYAKS